MDFRLSEEQHHLQQRCQQLAKDFATRSAAHDREASHPIENYQRLREEGFLAFNVPKDRGGPGISFVAHTVAFEALAQGCPATALAFNMHASMVGPLLETPEVSDDAKAHLTHLVLKQQAMIAGNFSEASSTALLGARPLGARATKVDGGYVINGRKMFASMLEAADYCAVMTYPDGATSAHAGIILLVPKVAEGRTVEANWDPLGMRATRSDSLILKDCWVPDSARVYQSDDIRAFRRAYTNWFWASYSAVYLGIAAAAFAEIVRIVSERTPQGYSQSLAYHPDVRSKVAKMSAELEAARLITYHSAWLSDSEGPTDKTTAALFRAKYVIGEAVTSITRGALTLGGTHAIFKGSRLEQLFRDGALGPIQPPQTDFCLFNMSLFELGLDEADLMSPLKAL